MSPYLVKQQCSDERATDPARIPPGGFRELGPDQLGDRQARRAAASGPRSSTCSTCSGQHKLLFLAWLPFSGYLLYAGKLSRKDAELVILRVGSPARLRVRAAAAPRLARSRGIDAELQAKIFEGPDAEGLTDRQRALITATDEFVITRVDVTGDLGGAVEPPEPRAADRILHSGRAIRCAGGHHGDAEDSPGLPGLNDPRSQGLISVIAGNNALPDGVCQFANLYRKGITHGQ